MEGEITPDTELRQQGRCFVRLQVRCFPSPGKCLHFQQPDKQLTFALPERWIFRVLSWHCYRLSCLHWSRSLMFFSRSHPLIADNWAFQPRSQSVPAWSAAGLAQEDEDNLDCLVSWIIRVMLLEFEVNLRFGLCRRTVVEVFQRSRSWGFFSVHWALSIIFHPVEQHPTCTLNGTSKIAAVVIKNRNKYWICHVYVTALRL